MPHIQLCPASNRADIQNILLSISIVFRYDPNQFWKVTQERQKKYGDNYGPDVAAALPQSLAYCSWTEDVLIEKIRDKITMKTTEDGRGQHNSFRLFDVHGQGVINRNTLKSKLEEWGFVLADSDLLSLFAYFDEDGDGVIGRNDFVHRVLPPDFGVIDSEACLRMKRSTCQVENLVKPTTNRMNAWRGANDENGDLNRRGTKLTWVSQCGVERESFEAGHIHTHKVEGKQGMQTPRGMLYGHPRSPRGGRGRDQH